MTDILDATEKLTFPPSLVRTPVAETSIEREQPGQRFPGYRLAAIVPCHNEEVAIGNVVRDLLTAVPDMTVYVYDNRSTDRTADVAREAGAIVRVETMKGKGNVVRRAFADIDADVYLLVDGDDTYDASAAPAMIRALLAGPYDHVLGIRAPEEDGAYREGHERGNRILNRIVGGIFGSNVGDMLSGYRVFSRRFVKSFPAVSREFEIETELTVHCLALRVPATSLQIGFKDRAEGSESKLRTYRDGWKILKLIVSLARHERPIAFYGLVAALFTALAGLLAIPFLVDWAQTGTAGHSTGILPTITILIASALTMAIGLILDGTRKGRHEGSRLAYLNHAAVQAHAELRVVPSHLVRSAPKHETA
jgi:hypothetical protein